MSYICFYATNACFLVYLFVHEHNVPAGMLIDGSWQVAAHSSSPASLLSGCVRQARLPERFLESREPLRRVTGPEGSEKFQAVFVYR